MKTFFAFLFSWILFYYGSGQTLLEGKIYDEKDHPVAYATIGIKGVAGYTFSNEQGYFRITAKELPVTLQCSEIGFETRELMVSNSSFIHLQLTNISYPLKEVTINSNAAYLLFQKSYKRMQKFRNYDFSGKAFYRLVTRNDNVFSELMEAFYSVKARQTGFSLFELTDGRYAIDDNYKRNGYVISIDFSSLVKLFDLNNEYTNGLYLPDFPYTPFAKNGYDFSNDGTSQIGDKQLHIIQFKPKRPQEAFEGRLYIDEKTGNLFRVNASYYADSSSLVHISNSSKKIHELHLNFRINYTESPTGIMQLSVVAIQLDYKLKNGDKMQHVETAIECFVYDKSTPMRGATSYRTMDRFTIYDYPAIRSRVYIPERWEENQIIAQTVFQKLITDSFEAKGFFGPAYTNQDDTTSLEKIGLTVLNHKTAAILNEINPEPASEIKDPWAIELTLNGKKNGSLCNQLFLAQNCYKDSFYCFIYPVLNRSQTWVLDSLKDEASFLFVFKLYARLAQIHGRKLALAIHRLPSPCNKSNEIAKLLEKANMDLFVDETELLNDTWKGNDFLFWERYIEKEEQELNFKN